MVLSRLTKITGSGIRTDTNWVGNNANYTGILTAASLGGIGDITATGIITAASFSGDGSGLIGVASTDNIITGTAATFNTYPVDINAGMTVAGVATFAGNVSIAGTLTYEDVTNIDSVGIITGKGADINGDLDVDGHTNLDNVSIAGVTTFSDDVIFNGANFDITYDRSINTFNFDQSFLKFGTNGQLVFRSTGPFSTIDSTAGLIMTVSSLEVKQTSGDKMIRTFNNGAVELYHDDNLRLTTSTKGIQVGTGVTIETNGQATFVGIVTFGSSSTTINGNTDTVNVGTALTLGHSQGLQYHTQNLHAQGFEVNQINASGIITATTFSGSGASLTNLNGSNIASGTVPVARIGTGTKNTSTFYRGDGTFATVTAPAITAINSASNNRIVTSDGGTTVTAESTLLYSNPNLEINTDTSPYGCLILNGNTGGLIQFEDNEVAKWSIFGDHALNFYNNANSVSRLYINSSGQMGLGVEPNTNWPSNNDFKALQIGTGACVFGRGSGDEDRGGIAVNWYSDGSNNKYLGNGNASRIYLADGNIYFSTAGANSSGANASMTLTDRMIITSTGKFGLNQSAPQYAMHLSPADGQSRIDLHMTNDTTGHNNNDGVQFGYQNSAGAYIWNFENTNIYFATNNSTRLYIKNDELRNNTPFYSNTTAITQTKTITTSYNAMSVGNITINSGVTVTVNSGARWVIV